VELIGQAMHPNHLKTNFSFSQRNALLQHMKVSICDEELTGGSSAAKCLAAGTLFFFLRWPSLHVSYSSVDGGVQNYLKSESTLSVTNEIRALALDACSRLVYPLNSQSRTSNID